MTISKYTLLLSFVLLLASSEYARAQNGVCRVTVFSADQSIPDSWRFSDPVLMGEFELKIQGSMIDEHFEHKESGILISVNVTRVNCWVLSKKPLVIRLEIQLRRTRDDSYSFNGGAAESIYDKNWRASSVSSHLRVSDYKGYTFTVACEKRKAKVNDKTLNNSM